MYFCLPQGPIFPGQSIHGTGSVSPIQLLNDTSPIVAMDNGTIEATVETVKRKRTVGGGGKEGEDGEC